MERSPGSERARAGFTLIEVLIAVAILSGAMAGAALLLTSAFGTYRHQNQTMEVFHVVHDQVEELTATPYTELSQRIKGARHAGEPARPDLPPQRDFSSTADGSVQARFELEPQGPDDPTYAVRARGGGPLTHDGGKKAAGTLEGTVQLQYWDPTFDAPTTSDRGLIRATIAIQGSTLEDHAVKYFAR